MTKKRSYLFLAAAAVLIGIDQLIKVFVSANLPRDGSVVFIKNFLNWTYIENRGAAFSILEGKRWLLVVATFLMVCICIYLLLSKRVTRLPVQLSLALIIAGGVGNLIDRVFRGYVVDYIDLNFKPFDGFAIFNFADCLVVVGTILLFVCILFEDFIFHKKPIEEKETPNA